MATKKIRKPYCLIGVNGSPYSMKLRAIMRYLGIPHDWVLPHKAMAEKLAYAKPMIMPILQYPKTVRLKDNENSWRV